MHPPGWLTVGGFAVGGNGVGPDAEPVSAMRLSLSPVGISDGAIVVAGSVLFVLVVLGALDRLCLESLRGGLVMVVGVPVAKPCCFIKSWMAALMVAICVSKLFWVSCIAVWACCMWLSCWRSSAFSDSRLFLDRLLLLLPVGSVFCDCMVIELSGELSPGGALARISL